MKRLKPVVESFPALRGHKYIHIYVHVLVGVYIYVCVHIGIYFRTFGGKFLASAIFCGSESCRLITRRFGVSGFH